MNQVYSPSPHPVLFPTLSRDSDSLLLLNSPKRDVFGAAVSPPLDLPSGESRFPARALLQGPGDDYSETMKVCGKLNWRHFRGFKRELLSFLPLL